MTKKNIILTAALAAVAGAAGLSATAAHADTTTSWTGTTGEVRDGEGRFKMRGRLQYDMVSSDWADFGTGTADENGTRSQVRRAFLGVQGRISDRFRYKVDFVLDPGHSGDQQVGVDDAYLEYAADTFSIVIGESNITSPLEDRISSLDTPFNERAYITNAFGYGRAAGIGAIFSGANWSLSSAVQGDSLNSNTGDYNGANANEAFVGSVRGTWDPIISLDPDTGLTLLHLGLSARMRDNSAGAGIAPRPELGRGTTLGVFNTVGGATALTSLQDTSYGAEVAGQFGAFGFQAEYAQMTIDDTNLTAVNEPQLEFDSYYVDAYWSITGESRSYDAATGSFKATRPARPLGEGGFGHLGLAARYDTLDTTDAPEGAEIESYALGLTWIPIDHVLFRLNWAHTEADYETVNSRDDEADIVSLRTQFDF
jgi:phosphate-selective porin OprO/OprP